jgi:hypothetical protein
VRLQPAAEALLGALEELAVRRDAQPRIGEAGVPVSRDLGRAEPGRRVVGDNALHPQVEQVVRIRLTLRLYPLGEAEPDVAGRVGVRPRRKCREVLGQELLGNIGRLREPHQVALHVRDTVRAVRVPDEYTPPAGCLPPERPAQALAAVQVRHRAACVVVGDCEIPDAGVREQRRQCRNRARDIRLHRRDDGHVVLAERFGEPEPAGELVDRVRLGVHAERQRADLDPAFPGARKQLLARRPRSRCQPRLERPGRLDVPPEAGVLGPVVGRFGKLEHRVEVLQMVGKNAVLRVGVTDVEVRLVAEEDLPAPLRLKLERDLVSGSARLGRKQNRPRLAHLGHVEKEAMAPWTLDGGRGGPGQRELHPPEPGLGLDDDANSLLESAVPVTQKRQARRAERQTGHRELGAADAAPELLARAAFDVALGKCDARGALGGGHAGRGGHPDRHPRPVESTSPRKR